MSASSAPIPKFDRMPNGRAAMWWVIFSEVVIFGGLIASYLLYRIRFPEWTEMTQHTSTPLGALNTLILLTSSFFAVKAHDFAIQKNIEKARLYIWFTVMCGFMFLGVKSVEYYTEITHGFTVSSHTFWSFYFAMTGLHVLHVIGGMTALIVISFQIRDPKYLHRVEMGGLYWHLVDLVWIFLFPLLYVAK
jgi:heme/copper-type cytochrome/quinol oxidase subunit 3